MTISRSLFVSHAGICPLCGKNNGCAFSGGKPRDDTPCWCAALPISSDVLDAVPAEARNKICICRNCAAGR
jgi:hypothetical protein